MMQRPAGAANRFTQNPEIGKGLELLRRRVILIGHRPSWKKARPTVVRGMLSSHWTGPKPDAPLVRIAAQLYMMKRETTR